MIFAAITLAASPLAADAGSSGADEEIVVLGQKLKYWRGSWKKRKGTFTCKTTRSSGNKVIDQIGCSALQFCVAPRNDEMAAILEANRDKAVREKLLAPIYKEVGSCLVEKRSDGIAALAEQRAAQGAKP